MNQYLRNAGLASGACLALSLLTRAVLSQAHSAGKTKAEIQRQKEDEEAVADINAGLAATGYKGPKVKPSDIIHIPSKPQQLLCSRVTQEAVSGQQTASPFLQAVVYAAAYEGVDKKGTSRNELIARFFAPTQLRVVHYRVTPTTQDVGYRVFDPILLRGATTIVFKYGEPDEREGGTYGLYALNTTSRKITCLYPGFLQEREVQVSPDGRYAAFTVGQDPWRDTKRYPEGLWVSAVTTGQATLVSRGWPFSDTCSWINEDEILYSLSEDKGKKVVKNEAGDEAFYLTAFVSNLTTRQRRRVAENGVMVRISPDRRYGFYGKLKNPYQYSNDSLVISIKDLSKNVMQRAPRPKTGKSRQPFLPSYVSWGQRSGLFYFPISEEVGEKNNGPDDGLANHLPTITRRHTVYQYDIATKSLKTLGKLESQSTDGGTDMQVFALADGGSHLILSTEGYIAKRNATTEKLSTRYGLKALEPRTGQWKTLLTLDNVYGMSGLDAKSKQTIAVTY